MSLQDETHFWSNCSTSPMTHAGETCERCSSEFCCVNTTDTSSLGRHIDNRMYVMDNQPSSCPLGSYVFSSIHEQADHQYHDSYRNSNDCSTDDHHHHNHHHRFLHHDIRHVSNYQHLSPSSPDQKRDCGLFRFRPLCFQRMASIRFFVFVCCMLVTLQQALSSGYFNSVITTIEKRFDVPSKMSGAIASTFEIGNLCTIVFVSYFGTHRHIPVWIGKGVLITGVGSLVFALPHFLPSTVHSSAADRLNQTLNRPDDNMCHLPITFTSTILPAFDLPDNSTTGTTIASPLLPQHAHLLSSPFADHFVHSFPPQAPEHDDIYCDQEASFGSPHIIIFMLAMVLIGCGGTPIFTLGTIYIDDHVRKEDSSMYIGCMYSMVAFGLVVGFLLGGYFITIHENSFGSGVVPPELYNGHPRWIGAWWAGFVLLGLLLILVAVPFFAFPRTLRRDRLRKQHMEQAPLPRSNRIQLPAGQSLCIKCRQGADGQLHLNITGQRQTDHCASTVEGIQVDSIQVDPLDPINVTTTSNAIKAVGDKANMGNAGTLTANSVMLTQVADRTCRKMSIGELDRSRAESRQSEPERKLSNIPASMYKLLSNPIYIVTCLGSCMELCIVSGFLVFLPKYLETQFTIGKSQANLFAGGIAVPGACVGIFLGGYLLKKLQLKPKDAIQFVLFFNLVCMGLYTALYFLGCDNIKMAGATHPYSNSSHLDAFQVNLTSECNRNCACSPNEIEPVCGLNGITYFSPCHAGCQLNSGPRQTQNYSNCACIMEHWPSTMQTYNLTLQSAIATAGPCSQACKSMLPFLILLFVVTLVVSITQMPLLMVILRSVDEDERAFALGMQFVLFRLFGYIPSPILFGNVIDSTCLLWKANCGRQGGFCLLYNIEHFRLRYVGVCSALKVAAGLLFFLDWLLICYRSRKELQQPVQLTIGDVVSSIYTLDQQIASALEYGSRKLSVASSVRSHHPLQHELELLTGPDSDYNSANDDEGSASSRRSH